MRKRYIVAVILAGVVIAAIGALIVFGQISRARLDAALQAFEEFESAANGNVTKADQEFIAKNDTLGVTSVPVSATAASDSPAFEGSYQDLIAWKNTLLHGEHINVWMLIFKLPMIEIPLVPDDFTLALRQYATRNEWPELGLWDYPGEPLECAALLVRHAKECYAYGDFDTCQQDLIAALRWADASKGYYVLSIYDQVGEFFDVFPLREEHSKRLMAYLASADKREELRPTIRSFIRDYLAGTEETREYSLGEWIDKTGIYWGTRNWIWLKPICKPFSDDDKAAFIEVAQRIAGLPDLPYPQLKPKLDEIRAEVDAWPITRQPAEQRVNWVLEMFYDQAARETRLDLMQMGLLLQQYYAEHSVYPETLEAIARDMGGVLPLDPFTDQEYSYESDGKSYVIFSMEGDIAWVSPLIVSESSWIDHLNAQTVGANDAN